MANSSMVAQKVQVHVRKRIKIIHPGVNRSVFHPYESKKRRETKVVLTIGRKIRHKGFNIFLEAAKLIYREYHNIAFVVVNKDLGNISLPPPFELVIAATDEELARLYSSCDVFVWPSWYETFGLPPLEAMSCGAPVITADSEGIHEYATNGLNCIIVPPRDASAIAESVLKILEDKNLSHLLSKQGVKTAKRFTWDSTVSKFENALKLGIANNL